MIAAMTKAELRRLYRARRRDHVAALSAEARDADQRRLADIVAPLLTGVAMAASYAAVGDEIDPVHIEKRLGPHAFPRVDGRDISFRTCAWADMVPGFQGIPEPPVDAPVVTPDLLLVPLTAVTLAGVRLGQGRAYYDRALARLRQRLRIRAIGLAWDVQIADALPADSWDAPLDWVATPTRLVDCARHR